MRERELEVYCRALRQLHDLQLRHHVTYQAQCSDYLEVGCSVFGMQTGIVSRVEQGMYHIDAVRSPSPRFRMGQSFPVADTICDRVMREGGPLAIEDLGNDPDWARHPAYSELQVRSYIGAPIALRDRVYGTLNFSSTEPRKRAFAEFEIEILDLMAESMARFIDLKEADEVQGRMREEQVRREVRQAAQMGRSERLAALGLLATGVAHEINNPLQGMRSHLSAARRALPPDFPKTESLDMVAKGIDSIAAIVAQLLSLQAPESPGQNVCEASETATFVARFLAPDLRKRRIRLHHRISPDLKPVALSHQHLMQILLNLLINARDALPKGGDIWMDAEQNETETHIMVADNGRGFDPVLAEQIFTPFFTTKGAKGSGLGLAVVESLVREAKGRVMATSEAGQGSAFHLHLPNASAG